MGTAGRESEGVKRKSFDRDVFGENWIRIAADNSVFIKIIDSTKIDLILATSCGIMVYEKFRIRKER